MDDKIDIDVSEAEDVLAKARLALDQEKPKKARGLSEKAENMVRDQLSLAHSAKGAVEFAERSILKAQDARIDVQNARDFLTKSKRALKENQFEECISLAERAVAATMVKPKPGREITIKTVFARVENRILYKVLVRNNLGQPLNRINIIPDTSNSIFIPSPQSEVISLKPFGEEARIFELSPMNEESYTAEEFVPGRDASISTVLTGKDEGLVYRIKIRNESERSLETLHIEPFSPEGYVPVPSEAYVNIPPYASRTVEFTLNPERRTRSDTEVECPYCHGTFIVDRKVQKAICPWCHNEVDVGGIIEGGGPEGPDVLSPGSVKVRPRPRKKAKGGQRSKKGPKRCPVCSGKGRVMVRGKRGRLNEQMCPRCKGAGKI